VGELAHLPRPAGTYDAATDRGQPVEIPRNGKIVHLVNPPLLKQHIGVVRKVFKNYLQVPGDFAI